MAFSAGGSFQQGLSGLNAAQRGLEVIANNVSNASVVGFKGSDAEFSDVFARAFNGARSTNGIGLGTSLAAVTQNFKQGNINVTGNPLDLAISGTGFFKVQAGNGDNIYTRNGQFTLNNEGKIVNSRGDRLQGFPVDAATGRPSDVAQEITVPRGSIPPAATRAGNLELNLDARATAGEHAVLRGKFAITEQVHHRSATVPHKGTAQHCQGRVRGYIGPATGPLYMAIGDQGRSPDSAVLQQADAVQVRLDGSAPLHCRAAASHQPDAVVGTGRVDRAARHAKGRARSRYHIVDRGARGGQ